MKELIYKQIRDDPKNTLNYRLLGDMYEDVGKCNWLQILANLIDRYLNKKNIEINYTCYEVTKAAIDAKLIMIGSPKRFLTLSSDWFQFPGNSKPHHMISRFMSPISKRERKWLDLNKLGIYQVNKMWVLYPLLSYNGPIDQRRIIINHLIEYTMTSPQWHPTYFNENV